MEDMKVSINCITYNQEKYIAEAIESFLSQKVNFKYEILIHDDASLDRTPEIIMEYEKKYPDIIKPIFQKENQYSKGINVFLLNGMRAIGKYIAICEGDDFWTDPCKLQKQVAYMDNNPSCSMCFHAADIVKIGKGKIDVIKPYNKNCISPTEDIILGGGEFIATNSILYRKHVMDNVPDFYLNAPVGDYPLQILASTYNYAYYLNEVMSVYRVGVAGSWSNRMASTKDKEVKIVALNKSIINMLSEFNKYSNGKYSSAVNKKIIENEFNILRIERNFKQIKLPKYKSIYESMEVKGKIKIFIQCFFPNIYRKLSSLNAYIRN